jgi:hypothetical protein
MCRNEVQIKSISVRGRNFQNGYHVDTFDRQSQLASAKLPLSHQGASLCTSRACLERLNPGSKLRSMSWKIVE